MAPVKVCADVVARKVGTVGKKKKKKNRRKELQEGVAEVAMAEVVEVGPGDEVAAMHHTR